MPTESSSLLIRLALLVALACALEQELAFSQMTGDEAELGRLRAKAEEAMGNDDPDGAALSMGRAALLAKQLGLKHREQVAVASLYRAAEPLFRSQEQGYRAMALFRRAGGQLPASSGVCGSLALAEAAAQQAVSLLSRGFDEQLAAPLKDQAHGLRQSADDWVVVLASMITDYQCP
ncbi:MAG TPA: hypothetical protein VFS39_04755 [Nitrospira sp.]|nr:hypothetical protein [Nitrospira sp.]